MRKKFHANEAQTPPNATVGDEGLWYPGSSLESHNCSLEVLIYETFQVANELPKNINQLNLVLREIAIIKWETCADIYSASLRDSTGQPPNSSDAAGMFLAQQTNVCEEVNDHIK
ncbi:hypothetical protein N7G274_002045 [Stereocaulon virgatum]|uniref:Pectinesterase inhibitor domain-containing protein n=1 Tax=Stereocaulon virgatum TaxID=373712 RepID=A0ABR4ALQ1_9LECA